MEKAFSGPRVIAERMGGTLDVAAIAASDEDEFVALCSTPPAIHRFPGSMAKRVRQCCQVLVERYDGQAANVWKDQPTGRGGQEGAGGPAGVRSRQGGHLHRRARQAARGDSVRLARGGRVLRRAGHLPLGRRHRRPGLAAAGPGDEAAGEGGGQEGRRARCRSERRRRTGPPEPGLPRADRRRAGQLRPGASGAGLAGVADRLRRSRGRLGRRCAAAADPAAARHCAALGDGASACSSWCPGRCSRRPSAGRRPSGTVGCGGGCPRPAGPWSIWHWASWRSAWPWAAGAGRAAARRPCPPG